MRNRRLYGPGWRRARLRVLAEEPFCRGFPEGAHDCATCDAGYDERCAHRERTASTAVDHVVGVAKGGSPRRSNLQGLCIPCNSRKAVALEGARPPGEGWRVR